MTVNRSGRMNLFSLMQSISEMDDINKDQVHNSFSSGAPTHRTTAGTCAGFLYDFKMQNLLYFSVTALQLIIFQQCGNLFRTINCSCVSLLP